MIHEFLTETLWKQNKTNEVGKKLSNESKFEALDVPIQGLKYTPMIQFKTSWKVILSFNHRIKGFHLTSFNELHHKIESSNVYLMNQLHSRPYFHHHQARRCLWKHSNELFIKEEKQ